MIYNAAAHVGCRKSPITACWPATAVPAPAAAPTAGFQYCRPPAANPQEPHMRQASLFSRLHTMAARRRSSSMSASSDRATPRPPACN